MNDSTKTGSIQETLDPLAPLVYDYPNEKVGRSRLVLADCFEWLAQVPENTLHAVVTDPPYGVKEYES
ncbi:MAG: site-specific DNA-methyltransferase, partial [Chloroflexi bacterium]|nr:site-specific DNA-methyltransferase [Chloroflexota bacterium]